MYKAIVRRIVRTGFRALSAGDYEQVLRQFHSQVIFSFAGIQYTVHQVIVQGWPWNTLVATRLSVAAPRADGSVYQNDVMQFLRLRWGKVVEDHLYEDTYKLVNELQQRLSREEIDRIERQTLMQESVSVLRETAKGESVR